MRLRRDSVGRYSDLEAKSSKAAQMECFWTYIGLTKDLETRCGIALIGQRSQKYRVALVFVPLKNLGFKVKWDPTV